MKKQWNNKRGMALFLGAAVAATTILAVPLHGNGFAESKAAASEKTVLARKAPAATATQTSVSTATPAPTATSKP